MIHHSSIASIAVGLQTLAKPLWMAHRTWSAVLVDTLEPCVDLVMEALDHPEALVTDLGAIGDCKLDDDECAAASDRLGIGLSDDAYLYKIARRLREKGEHPIESP